MGNQLLLPELSHHQPQILLKLDTHSSFQHRHVHHHSLPLQVFLRRACTPPTSPYPKQLSREQFGSKEQKANDYNSVSPFFKLYTNAVNQKDCPSQSNFRALRVKVVVIQFSQIDLLEDLGLRCLRKAQISARHSSKQ